MSSTALKVLALVALLMAVGLGLVAYRMSENLSTLPSNNVASEGGVAVTTMAVVAIKPLTAYTAIPEDAVALVPVAVLPRDYYGKTDLVVGKAPLTDVEVGTTLGPRIFRDANTLVRSIPPGFQAMSLEINDVIAVGGFVRPGDLVDVLLYIRSGGREVEDSQARILLREVRVLAYEDRVLNDAEPSDTGVTEGLRQQQRVRRVRTAVLAVSESDTTRVMLGASLGELRLSLRGESTAPIKEPEGGEPGELLAKSGAGTAKPADTADSDQVVTLRELSAIKKKQTAASPLQQQSPVVIYRGSQAHSVGR